VALDLRRATRIITRRFEDALRPANLTSFQFSTLQALQDQDSIPQSHLAEAFGMDLSTLNRNVKPMLTRGLITSAPSPKDRRVKNLMITSDGKALFQSALPLWADVQRAVLAEVGEAAWPMMRATLRAIAP